MSFALGLPCWSIDCLQLSKFLFCFRMTMNIRVLDAAGLYMCPVILKEWDSKLNPDLSLSCYITLRIYPGNKAWSPIHSEVGTTSLLSTGCLRQTERSCLSSLTLGCNSPLCICSLYCYYSRLIPAAYASTGIPLRTVWYLDFPAGLYPPYQRRILSVIVIEV